jgi:hypothetical protein
MVWYRFNLKRSQRNVGAVVALEIALEAASLYAVGDNHWRFFQYVREYAAVMRDACTGRPKAACVEHRHWTRARDVGRSGFAFPDPELWTNIGHLCAVLRFCQQFFVSYTGHAYWDGWGAIHRMIRMAVQADLVDTEYQALALWWHTLRCRLAFRDSAYCTFI